MEVSIQDKALFLRLGIAVGMLPTVDAIRFADRIINDSAHPSTELLELAVTPTTNPIAIVDALGAVAGLPLDAPPNQRIVEAILDLLRDDLLSGRRDLPEAIAVIDRLHYFVDSDNNFRWELASFEDDYALVRDGIAGDLPTLSSHTRQFLSRFDGASTPFLSPAA